MTDPLKRLQYIEGKVHKWIPEVPDEMREAFDDVRKALEDHCGEIAEFNAGYDCAINGGKPTDQPDSTPHDVWMVGFAWGEWSVKERENDERD